jgi:conotoxin
MRMLIPRMITWTTAALLLTASVVAASAQIQTRGTSALHAQMQNATPIVRQAACRGWGPYCPPGTTRQCGPYRCWCARCY